ncbi:hypothetical protein ABB37_00670 [Leptomonas pyrrhocoris]|uniref:Uncharacterized protein n=1 Tax=Leptomonas pyrrhocoris TaxID=157538 RepID=A0A0N0VI11_LEPPY|nr:hypothetical protein ABB37_00670 [Leptomonas pyrrhocoris]KPA86524.1 hypothetical protein ABB37_00670 [Leptomonas pyrrhocoris]|eukprot:XP_015664963.1 hypothetical protein ABB37_00670 [Leptomonas pyrrhocoris]
MDLQNHLPFTVSLCVAALATVCFSLFYVLISLMQITTLLDIVFPVTPESPPNGLRQLVASIGYSLIGGETPLYLNQSAFAMTALLFSLVVLLILVEESLLRVKEKVRAWGKLPSVEVLHHYNRNSYDVALKQTGKGLARKKLM